MYDDALLQLLASNINFHTTPLINLTRNRQESLELNEFIHNYMI